MITGPQWTETLAERGSTGGRWGGKVARVCTSECKYQRKTHALAFGNRRKRHMEVKSLQRELGSFSLSRFFLNDFCVWGCESSSAAEVFALPLLCVFIWCLDTVDFLLDLLCDRLRLLGAFYEQRLLVQGWALKRFIKGLSRFSSTIKANQQTSAALVFVFSLNPS